MAFVPMFKESELLKGTCHLSTLLSKQLTTFFSVLSAQILRRFRRKMVVLNNVPIAV